MTAARSPRGFDVRIQPVAFGDKVILTNLMQLCQHDYSEFERDDVNAHGLFGYRYLDQYWTDPDRHPFLILADDRIAGFALVRELVETSLPRRHSMAEFFVLRAYRGHGVGSTAARQTILAMPGLWVIGQALMNYPAQRFWRRVVGELVSARYTERQDDHYNILEFAIDP